MSRFVLTARERAETRGNCVGSAARVPAPGEVGLDLRAACAVCGKRVRVTARGRYAVHKPATSTTRAKP